MKLKKYNHLIDVAFVVEGPWKTLEDIPYDALLTGMAKRTATLAEYREPEAFGLVDTADEDGNSPGD